MNFKYLLFAICLLSPTFLLYPKSRTTGQAIVRDSMGDIQYRSVITPVWTPITAGIKITERSFIRLNSPDSILTLSLPDGSLLRIIGISSLYLDYITSPLNNSYQTKFLLLSGRWFYSGNPNNDTRLIVNTDITTSVIENGSGGGYFFNGTNEFIIRTGRGIISYRQKDVLALVVDERQKVHFNIYQGFNYPQLATIEDFEKYIIFQEEPSQQTNTNTLDFSSNAQAFKDRYDLSQLQFQDINNGYLVKYIPPEKTNSLSSEKSKEITPEEINFDQLKILEDLFFNQRSDPLQVIMSTKKEVAPPPKPEPIIPKAPIIPKYLLTPIDIQDFNIPQAKIKAPKKKTTKKSTPQKPVRPVQRPKRKPIPKPVLIKKIKPTPITKTKPHVDVNKLLSNLEDIASDETPPPKKVIPPKPKKIIRPKPKKVILPKPKKIIRPKPKKVIPPKPVVVPPPPIIAKPIAPPKLPAIQKKQQPFYPRRRRPIRKRPGARAPQRFQYNVPAHYTNQFDPNDPRFQYKKFSIDSTEELMKSDFSSVFLY